MAVLVSGMALVAVVLLVSALASGLVERAPLSFPMIFLGLGFLLGGGGLGIIRMDAHNTTLEAVAAVTLALVLFLDAVAIQIDELRDHWYIPMLTLGPGTVLAILGVAGASYLLLRTSLTESVLLGAVLASIDPVVLRDIIRDENIPRSIRRALGIEAGMNDIVVLPLVLICIALLTQQAGGALDWINFLVRILIVSPLVGLAVGGIGAYLMGTADAKFNIRKEYQALYGIGLVLAAYAAGQLLQGTGFLSAFFAGLAITLFNVTLCECFREYGEVTAEMLMLLTFVLFGAVLSELMGTISLVAPILLALILLIIIRPAALMLVLQRATMSNTARAFMGWFGPRGLSALLLALLVVQAHVPGAERLLAITGTVVVVSVVLHGITATPLTGWYGRRVATSLPTLAEEREGTFTGLFEPESEEIEYISPAELDQRMQSVNTPILLDVRSRARYDEDEGMIPNSLRVLPDLVIDWAGAKPRDRAIVTYCSCPDDATSSHVARQLSDLGFTVAVLKGGYDAWRENHPVEPKPANVMVIN